MMFKSGFWKRGIKVADENRIKQKQMVTGGIYN